MSRLDQLEKVKQAAKGIVSLLESPEHGLATWWIMLDDRVNELISSYSGETSENDTPTNETKK